MRYRIKIITYGSGRKEYYPQVWRYLFWRALAYDGTIGLRYDLGSREACLQGIDRHFNGYSKKQTIEFEYITKQNIN